MENLKMENLMEKVENTKVIQKKVKKTKIIKELITDYLPQIKQALPKIMTPERFLSIMTTAITKTPKLAECTPISLISAMLASAQLGLEPNTVLGQSYLIPYNRKIKTGKKDQNGKDIWEEIPEVQFQLGYKGMLTLAQRSGEFKTIQAHTVKTNDFFDYELGLEPKLKHIPAETDRGEIRCFYAMYKLINGGNGFVVMSKQDVEQHGKKYSKTFDSKYGTPTVWREHFEVMAHKTVLKKLLKFAPVSTDLAKIFEQDNTVKNDISGNMIEIQPIKEFNITETTENNE